MTVLSVMLCLLLISCAIATAVNKDILIAIIIFQSSSMIMCIVWLVLESPDLAITEAAVGVGASTLLFFATFKKIHLIDEEEEKIEHEDQR